MELIPGLIDDVGRECLLRLPYDSFPSSTAASVSWSAEIHLPDFHRRRRSSGLTRSLFVLSQSGSDSSSNHSNKAPITFPSYSLVLFDPASGTSRPMEPIPGSSSGRLPMFCRVVGLGTDLAVIGGWDPDTWDASTAVHVFSFLTGKWRRGTDMPGVGRSLFGCAADEAGRRILVAGGHDPDKNALRSAIIYDVAADRWIPLPDMAIGRDECGAVFARGRFHVISGYGTDSQGRFDRSMEAFDPSTWRWDDVDECFVPGAAESSQAAAPCVAAGGGDAEEVLYVCRDGNVAVRVDGKWRTVAEVPGDVGSSPVVMATAWRDNGVVVMGSVRCGEEQRCYVLDSKKGYKWVPVEMAGQCCGHVQSGCLLEL